MTATHPQTILCVDDDEMNLELLEALLHPLGHRLVFATSGEDALRRIAEEIPDLILLDVMMPRITGLEVLIRIRADTRTRLIPVILLTALREEEERIRGIEAGCDDFISKPFNKLEVLARVRSLITLSFYRRSIDEKEKFASVIDHMADGVIVLNAHWCIQEMNLAAQKYLLPPEREMVAFPDFIYERFSVSIDKEALLHDSDEYKKFDIVRREDKRFRALYLEAHLRVLKNPAGEVTSIVVALRDVTEEREDALLKQDFLGFISHKLRTPTAVISEYAALLWEGSAGTLSEEQRRMIAAIRKNIASLTMTLEKFILLTDIKKDVLTKAPSPINLHSFLTDFSVIFRNELSSKTIAFTIRCAAETYLSVDERLLTMVLRNLAENAVKFNDHETVVIDISVTPRIVSCEIAFTDNGCGIPAEEHGKIFQSFYQIEKKFSGRIEGAGIGLALTKRLMEFCKGSIAVRSAIGKGSTFILTFPCDRHS